MRKLTRFLACFLAALLVVSNVQYVGVVKAAEAAGIRDQVKIMIGGAPVNEEFCREIGADGYSDTAVDAVKLAKNLLGIAE